MCSSEIYCNGNGQCFKDRGVSDVFCNCSTEWFSDSCQHKYRDRESLSLSEMPCTVPSQFVVPVPKCVNGNCRNGTCECYLRGIFRGLGCEIVMRQHYIFTKYFCENGGTYYIQGWRQGCMCPCGFAGDTCQYIANVSNSSIDQGVFSEPIDEPEEVSTGEPIGEPGEGSVTSIKPPNAACRRAELSVR